MDGPNRPEYDPDADNAYEIQQRVIPYIQSHMTKYELYDYPQLEGGSYNGMPQQDNLFQSNAINDFNGGRSIVNFAGQASTSLECPHTEIRFVMRDNLSITGVLKSSSQIIRLIQNRV